ncbi:XAC2610-related protein [Flavobacterium hauense]
MNSTIDKDSIETENGDPFLNLKTGYFLSDKYKSAVLIIPQEDSLFKIEIYTEEFNHWIKNDELKNLNINPIQFKWIFKDYNFDGQKDIYIQEAISNGLGISYGCLITLNPRTKRFFLHSETIDLGSIEPDDITKTITSIEMSDCMQPSEPCILTHKWYNNKLVPISKKCPDCNYNSYK